MRGEPMTRSLLADAFGHNAWATLRILDACQALSAEQLGATVPGTFGSTIDTLRHLVASDRSYLFVITGGALRDIDDGDMGLSELHAAAEPAGDAWLAFLATNPDPDVIVTRVRPDGTRSHAPLGIRLAQVVHHGTDHRSQVCTALTMFGVTPPEIDVWDFAQSEGRLSED